MSNKYEILKKWDIIKESDISLNAFHQSNKEYEEVYNSYEERIPSQLTTSSINTYYWINIFPEKRILPTPFQIMSSTIIENSWMVQIFIEKINECYQNLGFINDLLFGKYLVLLLREVTVEKKYLKGQEIIVDCIVQSVQSVKSFTSPPIYTTNLPNNVTICGNSIIGGKIDSAGYGMWFTTGCFGGTIHDTV